MSAPQKHQGFAAMSPERQREIASQGGKARSAAHKAKLAARRAARAAALRPAYALTLPTPPAPPQASSTPPTADTNAGAPQPFPS